MVLAPKRYSGIINLISTYQLLKTHNIKNKSYNLNFIEIKQPVLVLNDNHM